MLTREENELLSRIGRDTAMGAYMREFWMPAVHSRLLVADGAPRRVRLMGENFVAFRATDGRVGMFDEGCPHRCTSLALARNEDNALTCIFHGWKIDVSGKVVEVPSEPPERRAEFAAKVRVRHYPVHEAGGMVWVYLGQDEQPPRFPQFEFNQLPPSHSQAHRAVVHASWLQGMETTIDSSHLGVLHAYWLRRSGRNALATFNTGPTFDYVMKPYGFREAALRDLFDGTVYTRIREVVMPFYSFVAMENTSPNLTVMLIPIDDEWHAQWYVWYDLNKPLTRQTRLELLNNYRPWSTERLAALDDEQLAAALDNVAAELGGRDQVWHQDRAAMKEGHFSGLSTLGHEDFAVAESTGPIADRTREYLGSSDSTVIRYRRMMLEAVRAHASGQAARGLDRTIDYGAIRAIALRNRQGEDWREIDAFKPPQSLDND
ncbi:MAG TPA: Rieske 2Fe-2S domain-containing protein [Candidatus Binataceae bacterium]|nr:Rieske 2Fe-2S domain-containing protein [Candidatus Binataceae bacterium]